MVARRPTTTALAVKRAFDVVVAACAALVTMPVAVAIAVAIRVTMGRPVLFSQTRPGRHEVPFTIYKFRTMAEPAGEGGEPRPEAERLTPLGRLLRLSSLDELPQLVNVLRGDMSLVGPRPLLLRYLPWYTHEERRRFAVRPGITGLAQVEGRNFLGWDQRLALDVRYVETMSLRTDLAILARSLAQLARPGAGVAAVPSDAMLDLDEERRQAAAGPHGPGGS